MLRIFLPWEENWGYGEGGAARRRGTVALKQGAQFGGPKSGGKTQRHW